MYYALYQSPMGELAVTGHDQGLTALSFLTGKSPLTIDPTFIEDNDKFTNTFKQLSEYFAGERQTFDLPMAPAGTSFQKQVWQALTKIPCGETKSYAWLAKFINNEKAVRAVGSANGANPIALIVPCHRVIGSNGKLTGYAGGLALKAKLLMHEGAQFSI
jgi:methylated-DNA-[protein]-cysteine S-methyltransferase